MAGLVWYDCHRCNIRYSDIIHDDCPECGNPHTTPTPAGVIIRPDKKPAPVLNVPVFCPDHYTPHNAHNAPAGRLPAGVFFCPVTGPRCAIKPVKHGGPCPAPHALNIPARHPWPVVGSLPISGQLPQKSAKNPRFSRRGPRAG